MVRRNQTLLISVATTTLLGVGLLLLLPAFKYSDSPFEAVREGNALYQAGQYHAAAQQYEIAAQTLPEAAEIQFNQGNAFYKQYNYDKALEYYTLALDTDDRTLESRLKYNLGNVKYRQAVEALRTFQDALTPLRTAISYYRDSLALDGQQPDARYNLELAYRLLRELQRQQVQAQRNAEVRNQKTSQNQGQASEYQTQQQQSRQRDIKQDQNTQRQTQGQQAQQAPQDKVSTDDSAQTQQATAPQELSPEEAEQLVEIIRERARAAEGQRQQWRRARMRDGQVEKYW